MDEEQGSPWRLLRFALERAVRVAVWLVTLGAFAMVFTDWPVDGVLVLGVALVSVVAWLPTTVLRFRAAFFPGPPHPRLKDADGRGWAFSDVITVLRCGLIEQGLSTLPWVFLAAFGVRSFDTLGAIVAALLVLVLLWALGRHALRVEGEVARLESAVGRTRAARRRLERLMMVRFGAAADPHRHVLAGTRFRDGDVAGALAMLDEVREPERWHVLPLRAQMMAGSDPQGARALVAGRELGRGEVTMVQWLADLHEGHPERVRAAEGDVDDLLESVAPDVRGMLLLLLAAAWAPVDAGRARAHLELAGWSRGELDWIMKVWPAVGGPLQGVRWQEP